MDVLDLHGWGVHPPGTTAVIPKVHCSREGFVFQPFSNATNFSYGTEHSNTPTLYMNTTELLSISTPP